MAEFPIERDSNNCLVRVGHSTVRDPHRKQLGKLQATQELTDLKKLEGERRLLGWKD